MSSLIPGEKLRGEAKLARIPIKPVASPAQADLRVPKPSWIRAKAPTSPEVARIKGILREQNLHTVCEEASCPNLGECFGHGTATFMIMGDVCTRRCPFCDVAHGRPLDLDAEEPARLAETIRLLGLSYVVVTSVDRDDLADGGGGHFAACMKAIREGCPHIRIEILTPDFRKREGKALDALGDYPPDVFNHNLETVPRLYRQARPGADYHGSLNLIREFGRRYPDVPTKSGLMLGLGETIAEVEAVMLDLRAHGCKMLTLGQYLQPSRHHLPVERFVHPDEFDRLGAAGEAMGFVHVASGPMVRSSYHADQQAAGV